MNSHKHLHLRRGLLSDIGSLLDPFDNDGSDSGSGDDSGDGSGDSSGDGLGDGSSTNTGGSDSSSGSSGGSNNDNNDSNGNSGDDNGGESGSNGNSDTNTNIAPLPTSDSGASGIANSDNKNANTNQGSATTVTQVVYKTESPTFTGAIAGYTTNDPDQATQEAPQPTDDGSDSDSDPPIITSPANQNVPTNLPYDSSTPTAAGTLPPQLTGTGSADAAATSLSSADTATSGSGQTSGAAKAGIAIGVLAAILVVFLLVYLAFNRRRKSKERMVLEDDDEKINGSFGANELPSFQPATGAPRVSLRPVTQFLPNLSMERRSSRGATMAALAPSAAAGAIRNGGQSAWERPIGSSHSNNPANPFGSQAERIPTPIAEDYPGENRAVSPISSISPLSEKPLPSMNHEQPMEDPLTANGPAMAGGLAAGAAAGALAAGAMTRKASIRKDVPRSLDLTVASQAPLATVPGSPAPTEFSMTSLSPGQAPAPSASATAIAAAGGPTTSTVHRVQLDFKPTLEDEMELKAGQLVRLLHEYDDGWALCLRLDRSQQGVVPRTCLSTRPVKPRQNGPGPRGGPPINPSGPGARGPGPNYPPSQRSITPQGGPPYPRPESPMRSGPAPGYRPQSPAGRPMSPYDGRPASPAGGRPQSPGPRYQGPPGGRPQSPNGMSRRMSPPGPSRMNPQAENGLPPQQYRQGPPTGPVGRKPVAGQAY